jgi:hypothetical protein
MGKFTYIYKCGNPSCVNYQVEISKPIAPPMACGYCGLFLALVKWNGDDLQSKIG